MPDPSHRFAIFRTKKLRTHAEISKVGNHNDRTGKLPDNVDAERVALNRSLFPPSKTPLPLLDRVLAKLKGKKYRKDAVRAVEIVCAFSPGCEKFVPLEAWAESSLDFIKKTFGADNLVSAVIHADEKTPHLQCVIVPLVNGKLAAKRILGSRQKLRELQSGYHEAVKKYGLARGTKGSNRPHLSMQEIYQGTQEGIEIVQKTLDTIPKKSLIQGWEAYSVKLRDHLTSALEPLTTAKTTATLAALEVDSLRRDVADSEDARKTVADRLRSLDLVDVATRLLGYEGTSSTDGKSTIYEDDARKLIVTGNAFKDAKCKARAERGAISLTRHILEVDFDAAVRILAQHFPEAKEVVVAEAVREAELSIKATLETAGENINISSKIDHFAARDDSKLSDVMGFLEKIKGIARAILDKLVSEGRLWANRWGSACFLRESAIKGRMGVTIIGTASNFKQSLGSGDTFFRIGEITKGQPVAVVETPIDALSYHARTGTTVIATDGIANVQSTVEFLKSFVVSDIIVAQNGDPQGGKKAAALSAAAEKAGIKALREKPPKGQNWSGELLNPKTQGAPQPTTPKMQ